jgi:hypothetical protein
MTFLVRQNAFLVRQSDEAHFYCTEKIVSKAMKTVFDFFKIVRDPDISRSPFYY